MAPGSSRSEYEFVVVSGTCGTRYVENPGTPSYLENTVVIQNEPGIQEVRTTPSDRGLSGVRGDVDVALAARSFSFRRCFSAFIPVCVCMHWMYSLYLHGYMS